MSAHKVADCRIDCDEPGCGACEFAGNIVTSPDLTAAAARKVLKRRGWRVSVLVPLAMPDDGERSLRKDFCPAHSAIDAP